MSTYLTPILVENGVTTTYEILIYVSAIAVTLTTYIGGPAMSFFFANWLLIPRETNVGYIRHVLIHGIPGRGWKIVFLICYYFFALILPLILKWK